MAIEAQPQGFHTVTPYLVVDGAARLIDFLEAVFDAEQVERLAAPGGRIGHAEVRIGDSVMMLGDAHGEHKPMQMMLYVYVDDVDVTFQRALTAGAAAVQPAADQFYGDRSGGVMRSIRQHLVDRHPHRGRGAGRTAAARARTHDGGRRQLTVKRDPPDRRGPCAIWCPRAPWPTAQCGVIASRPAFAVTPSCVAMPPLAPIAPTSLPSTRIGKPPSDATPWVSASRLSAAGAPPLITSLNALLGRRNIAALRAFACAMSIEAYCVPSIVAWAMSWPTGPTTAIAIFQLCFLASAAAAMIALCAVSRSIGAP